MADAVYGAGLDGESSNLLGSAVSRSLQNARCDVLTVLVELPLPQEAG